MTHLVTCTQCSKRFCDKCLWVRYGEPMYDLLAHKRFGCRVCLGDCNCAACRRVAGIDEGGGDVDITEFVEDRVAIVRNLSEDDLVCGTVYDEALHGMKTTHRREVFVKDGRYYLSNAPDRKRVSLELL